MAVSALKGERLTPRELEVVRLLHAGFTHKEVAYRLGVQPKTVRNHMGQIYAKLGVHSRQQLALMVERGELD